jgi:hypothetical protein
LERGTGRGCYDDAGAGENEESRSDSSHVGGGCYGMYSPKCVYQRA